MLGTMYVELYNPRHDRYYSIFRIDSIEGKFEEVSNAILNAVSNINIFNYTETEVKVEEFVDYFAIVTKRFLLPYESKQIAIKIELSFLKGEANLYEVEAFLSNLKFNYDVRRPCKEYAIFTPTHEYLTSLIVAEDYIPDQIRSANHPGRRLLRSLNRENRYRYDLFDNYFILEIN